MRRPVSICPTSSCSSREMHAPLLLLRVDEIVREAPQRVLGLFGALALLARAALEEGDAEDAGERDAEAEQRRHRDGAGQEARVLPLGLEQVGLLAHQRANRGSSQSRAQSRARRRARGITWRRRKVEARARRSSSVHSNTGLSESQ